VSKLLLLTSGVKHTSESALALLLAYSAGAHYFEMFQLTGQLHLRKLALTPLYYNQLFRVSSSSRERSQQALGVYRLLCARPDTDETPSPLNNLKVMAAVMACANRVGDAALTESLKARLSTIS
jgi:hypothetical protein